MNKTAAESVAWRSTIVLCVLTAFCEGMDLQADTTTLRLEFPRRIVTPAALRQVLKQLAEKARAAATI